MGFKEAVDTCLKKLFSFDGRASRSEYWWFLLFRIIVILIIVMLVSLIRDLEPLLSLVIIVHWVVGIPVAVRRLHDTDRSGLWWLLHFVGLSIVLFLFYCSPSKDKFNRFGLRQRQSLPYG